MNSNPGVDVKLTLTARSEVFHTDGSFPVSTLAFGIGVQRVQVGPIGHDRDHRNGLGIVGNDIGLGIGISNRASIIIKHLGSYEVAVKIHHDVTANIKLEVKKAGSEETEE